MLASLNATLFHPSSFLLLGIPGLEHMHIWIGFPFFVVYLTAVLGNTSILSVIQTESSLHQPMFFFLAILSSVDLGLSTSTIPKMLGIFWFKLREISFEGCLVQMFFIHLCTGMESAVLVAMAYDHYVAICKSLLPTVAVSPQVCSLRMSGSYVMGFPGAMVHTGCMMRLNFCDSSIINHFMCDIFPLLQLTCSGIYANRVLVSAVVGTVVIVSSLIIFISYTLILSNILHIPSSKG